MFFKAHTKVNTDPTLIETLLTRSVSEIIPGEESLKKLLMSGKQLRIKLGIDPTSPNLHIGRAVPLLKLRDFQNLGHTVVFIIGDATGVVGDTSDKESERPMLTRAQVEKNLAQYVAQAEKVLDTSLLEVRRNSEWLLKLNYAEIGDQADAFSVADFIARDNIKRRLDDGKRVSLREVLYPLMQGYDSVAIEADVELGGTDQRFNLLAGRVLQGKVGQAPQHILMNSLILGTDGRKMSSSWGNTINLSDTPSDMFGKVMSVPDTLTEEYFVHCTRVPLSEVKAKMGLHPKDAKLALANAIVRLYHGEALADKAEQGFISTFSKKEAPDTAKEITVENGIRYALIKEKLISSNSEWTRLAEAGAIRTIGTEEMKLVDPFAKPPVGTLIRIGKHRFVRISAK